MHAVRQLISRHQSFTTWPPACIHSAPSSISLAGFMTDTGLNHRLRQRSRRAGLMIGLSMALTIAVCVGSFSVIYAGFDGIVGDFVNREAATEIPPTPRGDTQVASNNEPAQSEPTATTVPAAQPTQPPTAESTAESTPPAFEPDYQSSSDYTLRLRSEPSTQGGDATIVEILPQQTPLQYTGQDRPSGNPATDGDRWMEFSLEDGTKGWLREIDVEPLQP